MYIRRQTYNLHITGEEVGIAELSNKLLPISIQAAIANVLEDCLNH